jgi:hypothetical protein
MKAKIIIDIDIIEVFDEERDIFGNVWNEGNCMEQDHRIIKKRINQDKIDKIN